MHALPPGQSQRYCKRMYKCGFGGVCDGSPLRAPNPVSRTQGMHIAVSLHTCAQPVGSAPCTYLVVAPAVVLAAGKGNSRQEFSAVGMEPGMGVGWGWGGVRIVVVVVVDWVGEWG